MKTEGLIIGAALAYLFLRCNRGVDTGIGRTFVRPQYDTRRLYDIGYVGAAGYPSHNPGHQPYPLGRNVSHNPGRQPYPLQAVAGYPRGQGTTTLYSQSWERPTPWRWTVQRRETPWNGYDLGQRTKYYETVKFQTF